MSCGEVRTTGLKSANLSEEGCAMASLYSTQVTASGGRHGSIRSEDGLLDLKLALPRALGGRGDATNPEQLFAGGFAACFQNALLHVSRDAGRRFADDEIDVVARIEPLPRKKATRNATHNRDQTCSCSTAGRSCVPLRRRRGGCTRPHRPRPGPCAASGQAGAAQLPPFQASGTTRIS